MYTCKNGRHTWFNQDDADKCCNGYARVLAIEQPGQPLPADATNVVVDAPARYGRRWVKVEASEKEASR
jgi:hypothetical protein